MRAALLIALYLGVVLTPLGLAWAQDLPPRSVMDELASGLGLLALVMILAEFPLSGRFRSVSGRVGLDVTIRFHQLLARSALVFAMLHPFLYQTATKAPMVWDVTRRFSITWDPAAILPGLVAFVLLPSLVLLAVGRSQFEYRYETWRVMHAVGALAISGFGVWHALAAGRYSADPVLAGVWLVLLGLAAATLAHVYLFKPVAKARRPWRVSGLRPLAHRTWELSLSPVGHDGLAYEAGQFAWITVGHGPASVSENPFSIASSPAEGPDLRFVIKELGDFTRSLGSVPIGTRAYVDGAFGHLTLQGRDAPGVALIAGGVGVAPMIGILRDMVARGDTRPVSLIYANRIESQIGMRDELDALAARDGVEVVHILNEPGADWTGETGFVDAAFLQRQFSAHTDWLFLLCGPPPMLSAVETALIQMGVRPDRIVSEAFFYD